MLRGKMHSVDELKLLSAVLLDENRADAFDLVEWAIWRIQLLEQANEDLQTTLWDVCEKTGRAVRYGTPDDLIVLLGTVDSYARQRHEPKWKAGDVGVD